MACSAGDPGSRPVRNSGLEVASALGRKRLDLSRSPGRSHFGLFDYPECIINFDAEILHVLSSWYARAATALRERVLVRRGECVGYAEGSET